MKCAVVVGDKAAGESLPVRGAWIEMRKPLMNSAR